jgi:hypothetical protein
LNVPLANSDKVAVVDDADAALLDGYTWKLLIHPISGKQYAFARTRGSFKLMHRHLLGLNRGDDPVDHEDGDGLNNRRSNLAVKTHRENLLNRRLFRNNRTGYRGVCPMHKRRKYKATIKVNGKMVYIGHFSDPELAARAYDGAALTHNGASARLNFPDDYRPVLIVG